MATVAKNSVGEYASFTGTGVVTLVGNALEGGRAFSVYADGTSDIPVTLQEMDSDGARGLPIAFEEVRCTYNAIAGTLTRSGFIYASSNGGSPVNFGAGLKRAFVFLPAEDVASAATVAQLNSVAASISLSARQTAQLYTAVVATTDNVDVSSVPGEIDGIETSSSALGNVYVLAGQTASSENGAYRFSSTLGFGKLTTFSGSIASGTHASEYWVCGPNSAIKSVAGGGGGMAIGGAVTGATDGSVPYIASGNLAQQNAGLYYDAANKRLCIGHANAGTFASVKMHIKGSGGSAYALIQDAAPVGVLLDDTSQVANSRLWGFANQGSQFSVSAYTDSGNPTEYLSISRAGLTSVVVLKTSTYTVATLPSGAIAHRAFVTDEMTGAFRAGCVGGGSIETPVHYGNGAWKNG